MKSGEESNQVCHAERSEESSTICASVHADGFFAAPGMTGIVNGLNETQFQ
jgi:hypothetical protein